MDERQQQITEGAGLQESRLNQEFLDWLNKWGGRILLALLIVAGAWAGWGWWQRQQLASRDQAFVALQAALTAGSPDNLLAVAEEHAGRGQAPKLARLAAADIYLASVRQGVVPGGNPENEVDLLDDDQSADFLSEAERIYVGVLEQVEGDPRLRELEMSARNGLAAVAMTNNDFERGRDLLAEARAFAESAGFEQMALWLDARIDNIDDVLDQPPLYPTEDIAAAWGPAPSDPATETIDQLGPASGAGPLGGAGPVPGAETPPAGQDPPVDFGPLTPQPEPDAGGEGQTAPPPGPAPTPGEGGEGGEGGGR